MPESRAYQTGIWCTVQGEPDKHGKLFYHEHRLAADQEPAVSEEADQVCGQREMHGAGCRDLSNNFMAPLLENTTKTMTKSKSSPSFVAKVLVIYEDSLNSPVYR